jgi:hypothetical protein
MTIADLKSPPPKPITGRPARLAEVDTAALQAIAQAAIDVELFTIPLYMTTMYSVFGTHQINSEKISYYEGREWPGLAPVAKPANANEEVFNIIFSVFIQEMLHLQMAANLATAIGVEPNFTSSALQNADSSWNCYGPDKTLIPHIVDLAHIDKYSHVRVDLQELNANQCDLFLAIEQPEETARALVNQAHANYTVQVPLPGWECGNSLPLFGTIGMMYECYAQYISIEYDDGQTLWQKLYKPYSVQRDVFNGKGTQSKPPAAAKEPEFPQLQTCFDPERDEQPEVSFNTAINMMAAITDQGEGNASRIRRYHRRGLLQAVEPDYRENEAALEADYPSYLNDGAKAPVSAHGAARFGSAAFDHYERFTTVKEKLSQVTTWRDWHAAGKQWSKELLINDSYSPSKDANIPPPQHVADALNRLKTTEDMFKTLSTIASGSLYGVTSVLGDYWRLPSVEFPTPSMVGAGDRISFCWAVLGKAPDLSYGRPVAPEDQLSHACQGLSLSGPDQVCASPANYHTCRGSNKCHTLGGCGFVQDYKKTGGVCGRPTPPDPTAPVFYSAPGDNQCASRGGCAVPISASQLFPKAGKMRLFDFPVGSPPGDGTECPATDDRAFAVGDNVYDHAWDVYAKVMRDRTGGTQPDPVKPATSDLRLALPPST